MTVNTQPVAERPERSVYGLPVVEQDQIPTELRSLVARVHDLVDAVANTEADTEVLAEAAQTVEHITGELNVARRQVGTMALRTMPDGTITHGTITNIVDGATNPVAPPLHLERTEEGLRGEVTLNTTYQGPPGWVPGGWIAALLDQALARVSAIETSPGLTGKLEVDYRRPTPLFTPLEVTARVERTEGRKVFVAGEIRAHGEITAKGSALMIRVEIPE